MTRFPATVRVRMLLRSFAIQGSWNYETLIGAGFGFTILPALRHIYRGRPPADLERALARHTDLFNSHPYFVTVAAGAVARLEADGAEPAVIQRFKTALRGSLGSMGDRLVWSAWRPMSVLFGLVLLLGGAPWWMAVGVFLVTYNALHFAVRIFGLRIGLEAGLEVGRLLRDAPLQPVIHRAAQAASLLVGLALVFRAAPVAGDPLALGATALAAGAGFWLGIHTRRYMTWAVGGAAAFGIILGIIGYAP
jgi:mannose PTS system EIID component